MDQVWKGLSNLDPRDPGGFYKKTALKVKFMLQLVPYFYDFLDKCFIYLDILEVQPSYLYDHATPLARYGHIVPILVGKTRELHWCLCHSFLQIPI